MNYLINIYIYIFMSSLFVFLSLTTVQSNLIDKKILTRNQSFQQLPNMLLHNAQNLSIEVGILEAFGQSKFICMKRNGLQYLKPYLILHYFQENSQKELYCRIFFKINESKC